MIAGTYAVKIKFEANTQQLRQIEQRVSNLGRVSTGIRFNFSADLNRLRVIERRVQSISGLSGNVRFNFTADLNRLRVIERRVSSISGLSGNVRFNFSANLSRLSAIERRVASLRGAGGSVSLTFGVDDAAIDRAFRRIENLRRNAARGICLPVNCGCGDNGGGPPPPGGGGGGGGGDPPVPLFRGGLGILGGFVAVDQLVKTVEIAAGIEQAMIGVKKTTGMADEELTKLKENLMTVARTEVGIPIEKILEYAQAMGSMGYKGREEIEKAAIAMAKLDLAADDFGGADAARDLGKMLELTGAAKDDFERLASTIVKMGNDYTTTEGKTASVAIELGKIAPIFKLQTAEVIGLGAAMDTLSITPENARTAMVENLSAISKAVNGSKTEMLALKEVTGLSAESIKQMWTSDKVELFNLVNKGLSEQALKGKDLTQVYKDLAIGETLVQLNLQLLGSKYTETTDIIKAANKEFAANVALNEESAAASEAFNAKLAMLKSSFSELVDALYSGGLLTWLGSFVDGMNAGINKITSFIAKIGEMGLAAATLDNVNESLAFAGQELKSAWNSFDKWSGATLNKVNSHLFGAPKESGSSSSSKSESKVINNTTVVNQSFTGEANRSIVKRAASDGIAASLLSSTGGS